MTSMTSARLTRPADRFYWSVLDAPQWTRAGALPAGLVPLLEEDLPVPAESVHAVCAPAGEGRLVVCAAERASLPTLDPDLRALTPDSVPSWVEPRPEAAALNLLVGEFEPRAVRAERMRRHAAAIAALLLTSALVAAGLLRRADALGDAASAAAAETRSSLGSLDPGATPEQLYMEAAKARQRAAAASRLRPTADASLSLAALLRAWPTQVPSKPQSIAVSENGVTISVNVSGDAAPFLGALKPPAGWTLEEPRLHTSDALTRLTLQLTRAGGPP